MHIQFTSAAKWMECSLNALQVRKGLNCLFTRSFVTVSVLFHINVHYDIDVAQKLSFSWVLPFLYHGNYTLSINIMIIKQRRSVAWARPGCSPSFCRRGHKYCGL